MSVRGTGNVIKNVLILDDDQDSLEVTSHLIKSRMNVNLVRTKYPTKAISLANKYLFDMILIDVTINYQGSPFGGLEIYNFLTSRYGDSSIIAYSKFITDDLLKQYNYQFNFIEKGANLKGHIAAMAKMMLSLRSRQKCFIAMPFDKKYDYIFRKVKFCVENKGYSCLRIDQETFNKSIVQKIFEEIKNSKIVIFLAIDRNPNVYYEAGFAAALNKEIITITDSYSNLPFDIKDRNAIAFNKNLPKLEKLLITKLSEITKVDEISGE